MKTYKGKNLIPKGALKELLQSRIELRLEECLSHSTWNIHREKQYPAPLPLNLRNPPPELLTLRLHTLLPPPNELCTKCGGKTSCPTLHALLECQHALPNVASLLTRWPCPGTIHQIQPPHGCNPSHDGSATTQRYWGKCLCAQGGSTNAMQELYSCRYSGCAANRYIHGEKGALAVRN